MASFSRLLLVGCFLLLAALPLQAKEKVLGMTKMVYDAINAIQVELDAENWVPALDALSKLEQRSLNNYERAHVLNMKGYTLYQTNRMESALDTYETALALEDLPDSQVRALLTTVSQLALVVEDYPAAERYALRLVSSPGKAPPDASAHVILAQAYIGQEKYADAVAPLKAAIAMQTARGNVPRENWLSMLSAVYFNMEDYLAMREVLYELVTLYPKERYLINLAALHGQLGETDKQLALVESLLEDERLESGHHLLMLANLFLAHGLPYKAAGLLQREMEGGRIEASGRNLEMQSQAWYMAGEEARAIPPLAAAASVSENGELYLRVARLYMDIYEYEKAEQAAQKALDRGGLRDTGNALLLQGMALAKRDELDAARGIFKRASKYEESKKWASQWLKFIDNEQRRIAALTQ